MDLKDQVIQEYLNTGCGFRKLAAKYGVSRTTICKWVLIHQGIHNSAAVGVLTNSRSRFPEEYQYSSAGFYHTGIDNFGFLTHLNG